MGIQQRMDTLTEKYNPESSAQDSDEVFAILRELQERLANHEFLVSHHLSYADISMATALYMVMSDGHPLVDRGLLPIGRSPFAQSIRHEFPQLMAWADNLFNEHLPQEMRVSASCSHAPRAHQFLPRLGARSWFRGQLSNLVYRKLLLAASQVQTSRAEVMLLFWRRFWERECGRLY